MGAGGSTGCFSVASVDAETVEDETVEDETEEVEIVEDVGFATVATGDEAGALIGDVVWFGCVVAACCACVGVVGIATSRLPAASAMAALACCRN